MEIGPSTEYLTVLDLVDQASWSVDCFVDQSLRFCERTLLKGFIQWQ